jgi:peptide/nickel transport system substrate-binding protein
MATRRIRRVAGFAVLAVAAVALMTAGGASAGRSAVKGKSVALDTYPRGQTLYTSGTMYGPPVNWNPLAVGSFATGTLGLVYEPLFLYDPLADKFIPWLAKSGTWNSPTSYTLTLRSGVTWSDGQPLTANDVVFTINLGKQTAVPYHSIWTFVKSVSAVNTSTVQVTFSKPAYQEWNSFLYGSDGGSSPILPAHIWSSVPASQVVTEANKNPVGTGAYTVAAATQQSEVLQRNPKWWGLAAGYTVPGYIVDLVNGSNNEMLGQVLQGSIDLSNNFLPGISKLIGGIGGYGLQTYYPSAPYMLSANTAQLVMNLTKAPMNDVHFRQALARAINVNQVVNIDYSNIVKAANPTGLLPTWNKYVDPTVVKKYGFSYDPAKARAMLTAAGYKLKNGYFTMPNGKPINLSLIVPQGWSDWMEAIQLISQSAKASGIKITPSFPSYNDLVSKRDSANYDLVVNNDQQLSDSPYTYYYWLFHQPILKSQTFANYARYNNKTAWNLVNQLDQEQGGTAAFKKTMSQLETIALKDMPTIPMWYNGAWAQYNTTCWTGWPSSTGTNHDLPVTWAGYWNMTGVLMLTHLKSTGKC